MSPEHIGRGAHSLALALIGGTHGELLLGTHYTVLKDGTAFSERSLSQGGTVADVADTGPSVTSNGIQLYSLRPTVLPADGILPLELLVQADIAESCTDLRVPALAVTLVNFRQVEMDGCGLFCRAEVSANASMRFATAVQLPRSSGPQIVTVLQFAGDGLYSEAPLGRPAPWYYSFVRMLGFGSFKGPS